MTDNKKFWNFAPVQDSEDRTLTLYGAIAQESWFDDDVTPALFRDELNAGTGNVSVYISSPGGDVYAATQIYTMLKEYKSGTVTVKIDGMAASAASIVAMAGDKVLMAPSAFMLIHNPSTMAWGDHNDMVKAAEMLEEIKEGIINAYEQKTGLSRAKIGRMMEEETTMNAKEAISLGFADGIIGEATNSASAEAYAYKPHAAITNLIKKIAAKIPDPEPERPKGRSLEEIDAILKDLEGKEV